MVFEVEVTMLIISKYLVPKGYLGLALYPFIFLSQETLKQNKTIINHERIHLKQQLELLIVGFYLWYVLEFILRLCWHRQWQKAYRTLSFEREAYAKETDLTYLEQRNFWSFLKYIRSHEV